MLFSQLRVDAGQSVTLAWNSSIGAKVAGYKVYYGTASRNYPNVFVAANTNAATITGLVPGTTYYFAATSYTSNGVESALSAEASYVVPVPAATLTSTSKSAGRFSFTVAGTAGRVYVVQASTNLVNWVSIQTNTAPFVFVDSNAASFQKRFYRTYDQALYTAAATAAAIAATTPAQLTAATKSGGQFSFTVNGATGQQYVVQASTNLVDWVSVQTNTAPFVFVDTNTASFKQRFYRTFNLAP